MFSCKNEEIKEGYFSIKGNFINTDKETVILYQRTPFEFVPLDSAQIGLDGRFELSAFSNEKDFYVINAGTSYDIILLIDTAEQIEITADMKNLVESYKVKGSKESEKIQKLELKLAQTKSLVDSLGKIYELYFGTPNFDSVKVQLDSLFFPAYEEQKIFSRQFIKENQNSLTSLIAISQYINPNTPVLDKTEDSEYYYLVDSVLSAKFPNSPHVQKLNSIVAEMKKNSNENLTPSGDIKIGSEAPEFKAITFNGDSISISDFKGKFVLVHFWASWCKPCLEENENLKKYFWGFFPKIQLIQISLDQDETLWKQTIKDEEIYSWHHICDFKTWISPIVKKYGVKSLPSNFLVNPEGKIVAVDILGNEQETNLKDLLKKK